LADLVDHVPTNAGLIAVVDDTSSALAAKAEQSIIAEMCYEIDFYDDCLLLFALSQGRPWMRERRLAKEPITMIDRHDPRCKEFWWRLTPA
jgi:hypothetical protein